MGHVTFDSLLQQLSSILIMTVKGFLGIGVSDYGTA